MPFPDLIRLAGGLGIALTGFAILHGMLEHSTHRMLLLVEKFVPKNAIRARLITVIAVLVVYVILQYKCVGFFVALLAGAAAAR